MAGKNVSFEKFVQRVYACIPERTSTVEQKERAIGAKKRILNHPDCPREFRNQILKEIEIIKDEIEGMKSDAHNEKMNSSIFSKRNNLG